jgi:hypothetical protein
MKRIPARSASSIPFEILAINVTKQPIALFAHTACACCGMSHHKDLMRVSGIKQKETIDRKTRPAIQDLEKVFKDVYARVRVAQ